MKISKSRLKQIIKEELTRLTEVEFGGEEPPTPGDVKFGYEQAYKEIDRADLIDQFIEAVKELYGGTTAGFSKLVDTMSDEEIMQKWKETEELNRAMARIRKKEEESREMRRKPDVDTTPEPGEEFPKQRGMGRGLEEELTEPEKKRKKKLEKELEDLEHK